MSCNTFARQQEASTDLPRLKGRRPGLQSIKTGTFRKSRPPFRLANSARWCMEKTHRLPAFVRRSEQKEIYLER